MTLRTNLPTASATGAVIAAYTPGASDTFNVSELPAFVDFNNSSGAPVNVAILDGGRTKVGSAAATPTPTAVAASTRQVFKLTADYADSSGVVTMTFSAQPASSCVAYRS